MSKRPSRECSADKSLVALACNPDPAVCEFFGDDIAHRRIDVCYVADRFSDFTPLRNVPLGGVIQQCLLAHVEQEEKQANGLIYSDLSGRRKDVFANSACAAVYDIDHRWDFGGLVEQREREGCVGVTHTTHSHGKVLTLEDASDGMDWLRANIGSSIKPFTDELAQVLAEAPRRARARRRQVDQCR